MGVKEGRQWHHFGHAGRPAVSVSLSTKSTHLTMESGNGAMTEEYVPPRIWSWDPEFGGQFAKINRPTSGATREAILPVGTHPIQLYSIGSPNGQKVTIMLEELLAAGHPGAEYDAWLIDFREGEQFTTGFVEVNPNSKIPAMVDHSQSQAVPVFESGAILLYLAEKFGAFLPEDPTKRTEVISWLFWQVASTPFVTGGFGHFYAYAPIKLEYAINRFALETKRQLDLLDKLLATREFIAGDTYSIADMAIWPWYGGIVRDEVYGAAEFLDASCYVDLSRWAEKIADRPAVKRGRQINRVDDAQGIRERHSARDLAL
jgi:GST-like protein